MPVWGVWLNDCLWFSSSGASRKTTNLIANAGVVVTTDDARCPVVLEGRADRVERFVHLLVEFNDTVNAKYSMSYDIGFYAGNAVFCVTPAVVFGLDDRDFTGTPTRWRFPDPSRDV
jgi:hypothetical protein